MSGLPLLKHFNSRGLLSQCEATASHKLSIKITTAALPLPAGYAGGDGDTLEFDGQAPTEYVGVESTKSLQLLSIYFQLVYPAKFVPNLRACSSHDVEPVTSGDKKALLTHMEEKVKASTNKKEKKSKSKKEPEKVKKLKQTIGSKDIASALGSTKEKGEKKEDTASSTEFKFLDTVDIDVARLEEDRKTIGQNILNLEAPVATTDALLRSTDTSKDLGIALEYIKTLSSSTSRGSKRKSSSSTSLQPSKNKRPTGPPIIIIPNAMSSIITMHNAEKFFAEAEYTSEKGVKPKKIKCVRKLTRSRKNVEFEIIDDAKDGSVDWDRVVAVVALGKEWQFKDWNKNRTPMLPVDVFNRTFGFYISLEGAPIPKNLLSWSVKFAKINRDKRGLDSVAHALFWNQLESWLFVNKPEMC
ncbi:hypothetical protein TL16_g08977 [Triparma laevis f. inornata]|uniref:Cell division control protein 73 C-terminal domain-containing protein n=2 Tax=Triparma laevis TaxID=1534972 RepID=A0A9W6ZWK3_9STRA|nr:hypothetical protein TrLO_g10927 [Triparma laevis f. longispina]GMH81581.1 hypothetical protein TL16_g08977 [Triparma laevis f. inornata]